MRPAASLLLLLVAGSVVACSIDTGAILDGAADTAMDAPASDTGGIDVPDTTAPDTGTPPDDTSTPPGDTGADTAVPIDTSIPPDTSPPCTTHAISACGTSHTDIDDCTRLYDGVELAPRCPTLTRVNMDCRSSATASYCDTSASCPDADGCVEQFWIQFDLGAPQAVNQLRFIAGWWDDRPDLFEVWYSDSPTDVPDAGATLAYSGASAVRPHNCVTDDPCTEEVPDGCCPDGRSSPQVTDQSAYTPSCNLGLYFPKLDIHDFTPAVGRYWYLMVRSGRFDDRIWLYEVELRAGAMCR